MAPSLKPLYETLSEIMTADVQVGFHEMNAFWYEENGWMISGQFEADGDFDYDSIDCGWDCTGATGTLKYLEVHYYDADENEVEIPGNEIEALFEYLSGKLDEYFEYNY